MRFFLNILIALCLFSGLAFAAKKIIYFTAGPVPTTAEKAAIVKLNTQAAPQYVVRVRNSVEARKRSHEATDYVAGAIPPNYRDGGIDSGTPFSTVYNPNAPVLPDPFKRD
jgi:hypothetical protein